MNSSFPMCNADPSLRCCYIFLTKVGYTVGGFRLFWDVRLRSCSASGIWVPAGACPGGPRPVRNVASQALQGPTLLPGGFRRWPLGVTDSGPCTPFNGFLGMICATICEW